VTHGQLAPVRVPVIAGVAACVGTSTLAAALHARDGGRYTGGEVDVLACRGTAESLAGAVAVAGRLAAHRPRPVLAVTAEPAAPGPPPARLRWAASQFGGLVVLPHVDRWCERSGPPVDSAVLLGHPAGSLPQPLRSYADGLRALAAAVSGSGRLVPVPPPARAGVLWRGLHPIERVRSVPAPLRPDLMRPEVDDETLEAHAAIAGAVPARRAAS
jgi:hypothetical protein